MKKNLMLLCTLLVLACAPACAQHFTQSRYYNNSTGRLDYTRGQGSWSHRYRYSLNPYNYFGLRLGASMVTVSSDDPNLDGGKTKTGLNIAAIAGISLSDYTPIYFETGLQYIEKGGKKEIGKEDMTYTLGYLEVPLVVKYCYSPDGHFAVQPYFGGYLACGVGGKMKNFRNREAYNSFGHDTPEQPRFQRFDGGLKVGCGVSYDVLYFDVCYEYGLTNICHDYFDTSHNSVFSFNIGVNF